MTMIAKIGLTEVFAAPQGEGYHAGRWAVFVRLAGCPLACEFSPGVVCDTPYMQANMKVTLDELFEDILLPLLTTWEEQPKAWSKNAPLLSYSYGTGDDAPMLVFTGGEPTACPQFDNLVARARETNCYLAIETNGMYWLQNLRAFDWVSVSPKIWVPQTSSATTHNPHPRSATLDPRIREELTRRATHNKCGGGEYRYIITRDSLKPDCYPANRHYVSPAVLSNGSGTEWQTGFPGYSEGAVERCLTIIKEDPRWRISTQIHKMLGVR